MRLLLSVFSLVLTVSPVFAHDAKLHANDTRFAEDRFTPPDVELLDSKGRPRRFMSDLARGNIILISFFYASCTEICLVTNQIMSLAARKLPTSGKPVQLISITVDPERDTPAIIDEMADAMGRRDDWIWLTGAPDDVRRLTHSLGMRYERPEDHGVLFVIGDPDTGRFVSTSGLPDVDTLVATMRGFQP